MEKVENKVEMKEEKKPYVAMKDMTVDQIKQLPRASLIVKQDYSRFSGRTSFTATVLLMDSMFEHIFRIDRASYFIIAKLRNQDGTKGSFKVSFPYRIVRGKRLNQEGKEYDYYYIEGYACPIQKKIYLHDFLKGSAVDLLIEFKCPNIVDRGFISGDEQVESDYFDEYLN